MFKSSRQEFWHNNSYNSNNFIIAISRHIKNPGIVSRRATREEGGGPPLPFLKAGKSALIFGKKGVNCVQSSIQNVVLRASREKSSKMFACGAFFSCVFDEKFIEGP